MTRINRLVVLTLLVSLLAATGALAQVTGVKEVKLDNGLTVLMKESHAAPVFTAQVWFKVGSRNEHTGITGISHILEHMLFNTSAHYKKGEITRMIRERGGIENAATWTDFTYYWQLLSSENLELSLKTLAERAGSASLLNSEFQKERVVVTSELQGDENDPDQLLYMAVWAAAFEAHPYQWPTIGWISDVENINRTQLFNYYDTYYHPNNATLVLVGDFDTAKALALIKKYFGKTPSHKLPRGVYTVEPVQHGERTVVVKREGTAERVLMGYHTPALKDADTYALMVLDQVLSGGRSSRLYQALVEKQLSTSVWSSASSRRDPALFMLGATARQGVHTDALEKALAEQVEAAKAAPPTAEEMQSAKNQLQAYLIFQNDSVSDQGEQLGYYNTIDSWHYLETLLKKLDAVTPEQVQAAAKTYLVADHLTLGRFIPTGPATGGGMGAPAGPVHMTKTPGVCYYRKASPLTPALSPPGRGSSGAATPAPVTSPPRLVLPYSTVLDNGMVVIVQENLSNPTVAIAGNMKAGGYFDPKGKDGVASLVAEMIGRGTASRSSLDIAKLTDKVGASISTSAGTESASFSAKSLTKDFPTVLDLLADELRNASFPEGQFARAKGETSSELEESKESPSSRANRAFYNSIFPAGHPYHELTIEEAQTALESITRDDLISFYKSYYRPDTATIVIVGDIRSLDAVALVKKSFGDWSAAGPTPTVDIPTVPPPSEAKRIVIPMMDKSEVDVIFGHPMGLRRSDRDYYAVRIMNQILGGSGALGSLLGEDIREKQGLVYDVYSTFDATLGAGPWYASLGSAPKNTDKAYAALKADVEKFKKTGATKQQFEQAREFIVGVFPITLETNAGVARMLLSAQFYGLGMDYLLNYSRIYRSVTLEQVNAAAKKYLHPESATTVIAGPYQQKP